MALLAINPRLYNFISNNSSAVSQKFISRPRLSVCSAVKRLCIPKVTQFAKTEGISAGKCRKSLASQLGREFRYTSSTLIYLPATIWLSDLDLTKAQTKIDYFNLFDARRSSCKRSRTLATLIVLCYSKLEGDMRLIRLRKR